jgi:Ca-activated chloride channel homolog
VASTKLTRFNRQPGRALLTVFRACFILPFFIFVSCAAAAQTFSIPTMGDGFGNMTSLDAIQTSQMEFNLMQIGTRDSNGTLLENPSVSVSKLDLKAPWKARREYDQGYRLLMRKDFQGALEHLQKSIVIYPSFVAAHNSLGSAYLNLGQSGQASGEFGKAVALDDHLPNSYLNLGCAELALKQYAAAEEHLRKASSIAPLDLQLQVALAYGEFVNHDYSAVLTTARQLHERKHEGAAVVHFFAAGAWDAQGNLPEAQREMETLLQEDPKSASAGEFRQILEQIKAEEARREEAKLHPAELLAFTFRPSSAPTAEDASRQAQSVFQALKEKRQIAEAESASDPTCIDCGASDGVGPTASIAGSPLKPAENIVTATTFRSTVDEVALSFTATDRGKSVTNLNASDIEVRDDGRPPEAILGFRNESQLPLRLGLIIDTSDSVKERFSFEQAAAIRFLQKVVVDKSDLAFVIGVNNSVLLVQDFTADQTLTSRAVHQLAPGGGTALWDAVSFAADKLKNRREVEPVARILVVISDGNDNSSGTTLKQAIARAQRGEVAIYTVSTRDFSSRAQSDFVGDHALRTISELTGGTAFVPGSASNLTGSLTDLQQVIRSRYLVSYKPGSFQRNGKYRAVQLTAQKDGHHLQVFARRGYYASGPQADSSDR